MNANIIAVSETWMQQEIASISSIEGYNFEHKARANNQKGGDVGIFIDKALSYEIIETSTMDISSFEFISLKIKMTKNINYTVICIYRPPSTNIENFNKEIEIL